MDGSSNQSWLARSQAAVWHPCTQMQHHAQPGAPAYLPLVPIARGEGPWLVDFDGKRYLDGISSWWTNLFGHANPRINAALREQLETLEHVKQRLAVRLRRDCTGPYRKVCNGVGTGRRRPSADPHADLRNLRCPRR